MGCNCRDQQICDECLDVADYIAWLESWFQDNSGGVYDEQL